MHAHGITVGFEGVQGIIPDFKNRPSPNNLQEWPLEMAQSPVPGGHKLPSGPLKAKQSWMPPLPDLQCQGALMACPWAQLTLFLMETVKVQAVMRGEAFGSRLFITAANICHN